MCVPGLLSAIPGELWQFLHNIEGSWVVGCYSDESCSVSSGFFMADFSTIGCFFNNILLLSYLESS